MRERLGHSLERVGSRVYSTNNGSRRLISWSDSRCKICGKFKGKDYGLFCKKHSIENNSMLSDIAHAKRDYSMAIIRNLVYYLPQYLERELECYM